MRKITFAFLMAVLLIAPLMASGGGQSGTSSGGKIVLEFQHHHTLENIENNVNARSVHEMKNRFIKDHPEVTINETIYAQVDNHIKMMALAAANDMPDVFFTKGSWVQNFYVNNLMADLRPFIDPAKYRQGLCDPLMRDGKLLAVPTQFQITSVVYWNEPMWKSIGYNEFPKTWDDLVKADELFKARGITTFAFGNKDKWEYESCWLSALGDRFTGPAWTDSIIAMDGRSKFTDPDFVTALRYSQQIASMFNRDFLALTNQQAATVYATGKSATFVDGSWNNTYLLANGDAEVIANTRLALLPSFPNQKGDPNASSGGAWAASASSKLTGDKLKAAATLLEYITGDEFSQFMMDFNGSLGPRIAQIRNRDTMPALSRDFIDWVDTVNVVPIYDIQMDGAVIDVMNSRLQELLGGSLSPEALAAAIQVEQDKLVAIYGK